MSCLVCFCFFHLVSVQHLQFTISAFRAETSKQELSHFYIPLLFCSPVSYTLRIAYEKEQDLAACSLVIDIGCAFSCVLIRCAVLLFEVGSIGTPLGFRFQTQDGLMEPLPMQNLLYLFSEPVCHLLFRNSLQFPEPRRGFGYVKPLWDLVLRVHSHF